MSRPVTQDHTESGYMEYYDDIMLVVANDERVSINGKDFRIITIENERHNFLGYWIEGVGMISNLALLL